MKTKMKKTDKKLILFIARVLLSDCDETPYTNHDAPTKDSWAMRRLLIVPTLTSFSSVPDVAQAVELSRLLSKVASPHPRRESRGGVEPRPSPRTPPPLHLALRSPTSSPPTIDCATTTMPSPYLPGPFLELDPESLAASGELNVDQLAALWNGEHRCDCAAATTTQLVAPPHTVFTKVGDSLHKGRRLENFAWRAWHREAHLVSLNLRADASHPQLTPTPFARSRSSHRTLHGPTLPTRRPSRHRR